MGHPELNPRLYAVDEVLRDGSPIHIRAITPDDKDLLFEHFSGLSQNSRYTRFFGAKRTLSRQELSAAIDRMRPRQRQIARLAIESHSSRERVCAVLKGISCRSF